METGQTYTFDTSFIMISFCILRLLLKRRLGCSEGGSIFRKTIASNLSHNRYENRLISDTDAQLLWIISFCQMCRSDPIPRKHTLPARIVTHGRVHFCTDATSPRYLVCRLRALWCPFTFSQTPSGDQAYPACPLVSRIPFCDRQTNH